MRVFGKEIRLFQGKVEAPKSRRQQVLQLLSKVGDDLQGKREQAHFNEDAFQAHQYGLGLQQVEEERERIEKEL